MEVVAPVDAIISGFQRSSDLTKRLQALRGKKRKDQDRFLEGELQLALDRARDELTQHKQLFVSECGFTVPHQDPFLHQVDQLQQIRTAVEVFYSVLQVYCDNGIPLKEPRKLREDADKWRFTSIQALTELRQRLQSTRGQPAFSPPEPRTHLSYVAPTQAAFSSALPPQFISRPLQPNQIQANISPSSSLIAQGLTPNASVPPEDPRVSRKSSQDSHDVPPAVARNMAPQHAPASDSPPPPPRVLSWAPEASSPLNNVHSFLPTAQPTSPSAGLGDFPPPLRLTSTNLSSQRPAYASPERRESMATFMTGSSSSAEPETAVSPSPKRRDSFFNFSSTRRKSSMATNAIECSGDIIRSAPAKRNNWHGFCPATFDILENPASGLQVVQRPVSLHVTRMFLQCKRCAFPGTHVGTSQKDKTPDPTIMVSAKGIRFRWLFLAKSHVKSTESPSGDIRVNETIARSAYRCVFCYLENRLPDKLGGLETLMNHIWQYHRGRSMDEALLRRAGCILGRKALSREQFDINIPDFADEQQAVAAAEVTKGDVVATISGLSLSPNATDDRRISSQSSNPEEQGLGLMSELHGEGPRLDPVELMGSNESYLV